MFNECKCQISFTTTMLDLSSLLESNIIAWKTNRRLYSIHFPMCMCTLCWIWKWCINKTDLHYNFIRYSTLNVIMNQPLWQFYYWCFDCVLISVCSEFQEIKKNSLQKKQICLPYSCGDAGSRPLRNKSCSSSREAPHVPPLSISRVCFALLQKRQIICFNVRNFKFHG